MILAACAGAAGPQTPAKPDAPHAPGDAAGIVARFYRTAVVQAEQVRLSDVAEIQGESAKLVAHWPIAVAPEVGGSRVLDLAHVQQVLSRRGVNLARWTFRGRTRCLVTRPGDARAADSHPSVASGPPGARPDDASGAPGPPSSSAASPHEHDVDPNTLEGVLREHIRKRLANLGGTPLIQFPPAVKRLLSLSKPTYAFGITDRSERLLGLVPLQVTIYEKQRVKQVLPVLAEVALRKAVVVAARPINRGETIKAGDLVTQERVFNRAKDIGLSQMGPLVGQRAKHFVRKGVRLTLRDIEPVPLVARNDLVTVWARRGSVSVKGSARAMSSGGYGESVELKNELSKEKFVGVVTGPKTVEIPKKDVVAATAQVLLARGNE